MTDDSGAPEPRRPGRARSLVIVLGSLVLLLAIGAAIAAGLRFLELPEAADPSRIEHSMAAELALLADLSTQLAEQHELLTDTRVLLEDDPAGQLAQLDRQMEAWRAFEDQAGPLDQPAIVSVRLRLWRGMTNRIVFVLLDPPSEGPDWELPGFEAAPEPGRPAVKPVYSGRRRLVRYSAKLGERGDLSYGFDIVFDLERLVALDSASDDDGGGMGTHEGAGEDERPAGDQAPHNG